MFAGKYIGNDIFGFSSNMDVVGNKFRTYILVESLEEITIQDNTKVAKLAKKNTSSEAAAKEFLIQEKKRPIEEDKKDIKAFFNQQLLKLNFKQFKAKHFGMYHGIQHGVTFELL